MTHQAPPGADNNQPIKAASMAPEACATRGCNAPQPTGCLALLSRKFVAEHKAEVSFARHAIDREERMGVIAEPSSVLCPD